MKFHIVYDRPGRLRVRCGPGAFTQEQGYGIAALLLARPGVTEVTTCPVNGSVLVLYTGAGRAAAVEVLRGLDRRALPVGEARDGDSLRQVDDLFFHETAKLAARYLLRKLLPWPVRWLLTLRQAAGYWKEGASSLAAGRLDVAVLDASPPGPSCSS